MRTEVEFGERQQRQVVLGMPEGHCIALERKSRIKMPMPKISSLKASARPSTVTWEQSKCRTKPWGMEQLGKREAGCIFIWHLYGSKELDSRALRKSGFLVLDGEAEQSSRPLPQPHLTGSQQKMARATSGQVKAETDWQAGAETGLVSNRKPGVARGRRKDLLLPPNGPCQVPFLR